MSIVTINNARLYEYKMNKKIIIVGSHIEALKFKPIDGYDVIAVNQAIDITREHTTYWFTLDPSPDNQHIMINKPFDCFYIAAVPNYFGKMGSHVRHYRIPRPDGVLYLDRISGDGPLSSHFGLCEDLNQIATGNSAYGALNLAYHLGASEIILLGISGDQRPKFDGTYCKCLSHLPDLFESAIPQLTERGVRVYTANKITKITCFPYIDIFDR